MHVDGDEHIFNANDSIYISVLAIHCLTNETDASFTLSGSRI